MCAPQLAFRCSSEVAFSSSTACCRSWQKHRQDAYKDLPTGTKPIQKKFARILSCIRAGANTGAACILDHEYDRAKVPPYNGSDPTSPKAKKPLASIPLKISIKKDTRGVRTRYDTVLLPFNSIMRYPGHPVIPVPDFRTEMNSPKNLANVRKIIPQKCFAAFAVPRMYSRKINSPRFFPACLGFVPGVRSQTLTTARDKLSWDGRESCYATMVER